MKRLIIGKLLKLLLSLIWVQQVFHEDVAVYSSEGFRIKLVRYSIFTQLHAPVHYAFRLDLQLLGRFVDKQDVIGV